MENVNIISNSQCMGCGVCVDVCPLNVIALKENKLGFLEPRINEIGCIGCRKCLDTCPVNNLVYDNDCCPPAYVVKRNDSIRMKSSSGGFFYTLASYVLRRGGVVVGVRYADDSPDVYFSMESSYDGLEELMGSKYVSPRPNGIYKKVKEQLDNGVDVLFSGSPCHIAALYSFLGKRYEKLITMDIMCHGAPSSRMLKSFLNESNIDAKRVEFRNKKYFEWGKYGSVYCLRDGTIKTQLWDKYYEAFLTDLSLRDSCYTCKYSRLPRQGDFTAGDYWKSLRKEKCAGDDGLGLSLVFINTPRAKSVFEQLRAEFEYIEPIMPHEGFIGNRFGDIPVPMTRRRFVEIYEKTNNFLKAVEYAKSWRYDVGIYGATNNTNYGGLLTYYSLYKAVEKLGYSTVMVNDPEFVKSDFDNNFARRFLSKNTDMTLRRSPAKQYELNDHIDTFVLGSDQVWNYKLFWRWGKLLYFNFVSDNKKRISYAASFGLNAHTIPDSETISVVRQLNKFDRISVREKDGVSILNDFNVPSKHVLDPVFLLNTREYYKLINGSNLKLPARYVGSYLTSPYEQYKREILKDISGKLGLPTINMTVMNMLDGSDKPYVDRKNIFKKDQLPVVEEPTLEDWLKIIIGSEFFITDSFHAVCVCIMFKKRFIVLQESWATSRLESLLDVFNLKDRWVRVKQFSDYAYNESWFEPLNSDEINFTWDKLKNECIRWLDSSISGDKGIVVCKLINEIVSLDELIKIFNDGDSLLYSNKKFICKNNKLVKTVDEDYNAAYIRMNGSLTVVNSLINKELCLDGKQVMVLSGRNIFDVMDVSTRTYYEFTNPKIILVKHVEGSIVIYGCNESCDLSMLM